MMCRSRVLDFVHSGYTSCSLIQFLLGNAAAQLVGAFDLPFKVLRSILTSYVTRVLCTSKELFEG